VELRDETRRALDRGVALFDAGRFFEAHEAWEAAWLVEAGDVRRMLHGLIQIAAGYHKALVQKRPAPAAKLLGAGLAKLEAVRDAPAGLPLAPVRAAVATAIDAARAWGRGERAAMDARAVPRLGRAG
jgi:predicted metal-dependent hydrolase